MKESFTLQCEREKEKIKKVLRSTSMSDMMSAEDFRDEGNLQFYSSDNIEKRMKLKKDDGIIKVIDQVSI